MAEWKLTISENTDQAVHAHLQQQGGELDQFVEDTVQQRIFWETVDQIQKRNADADPDEIQRVADEAVDWARENRP